MPRLFFAVDLDAQLLGRAVEVQTELLGAAGRDGLRWATRDQLHVTLKFLGDVHVDRVQHVLEMGRLAAEASAPFQLGLRDVGGFPDNHRPRVGWIGVTDPAGALAALARELETRCAAAGFPAEARAFRPHITLARTKTSQGASALAAALRDFGNLPRDLGTMSVQQLVLIESELFSSGSKYTRRATLPFHRP